MSVASQSRSPALRRFIIILFFIYINIVMNLLSFKSGQGLYFNYSLLHISIFCPWINVFHHVTRLPHDIHFCCSFLHKVFFICVSIFWHLEKSLWTCKQKQRQLSLTEHHVNINWNTFEAQSSKIIMLSWIFKWIKASHHNNGTLS